MEKVDKEGELGVSDKEGSLVRYDHFGEVSFRTGSRLDVYGDGFVRRILTPVPNRGVG